MSPIEKTATPAATTRSDSTPDDRVERLRQLVGLLEASTITELEYEDADIKVGLRRVGATGAVTTVPALEVVAAPASVAPSPMSSAPPPAPAPAPVEDDDTVQTVRSPFVGTFYCAPAPDAAPFTDVGQRVRRGQTVCIVEAMKLMNEIECEVDGTVEALLVENGHTVQHGDPLFRIRLG